jgi:DNA-binding winged helix-turn-helix (wHTH) protein/tetratricopeptide (TPR) repeat protein
MTLGKSPRSVVALAWRLRGENVKMAGSAPHGTDALGGVYQFADVTVDLDRFELHRAGVPQHVEPQVLEVLAYLIRHRDRLVTKHELMDQVWHDRFISDSAITSRIKAARRATGDDGERQNVIRTVHGRGYRFVAEVAQPLPRPEPAETATAGFVGRDNELATLWSSLAAAESGTRQLMLISGEPGIGKTAIVEAFLAGLDENIELVGVGQCHPVGVGEPYAPVLDAIFDLAKGPAAAEVLRCLDAVAPGWLLQLPALIDVDHGSSLVNRTLGSTPERMLREALDLFDALASAGYGPLVLTIDDLHWADRPTLDLITAVGRRRRPASLLVLGTYRHTDLDEGHRLLATVSELTVRRLATHIRLQPLSLESSAELIKRQRADPPPPDAMKALHRRSGGNPLFLGALLDTTAERGPDNDLPRSLREMVEHHLDRLQSADREVIEAAAVAGIDFAVQLLGSSGEVDDVWQRCHALARRDQLIAFDDRGRQGYFRFRHSLYQEVIYAGVPPPRRRALHQLVGERLEATTVDVTSAAAELAEHFTRSGDGQRAVRYRLAAAEVAALRNAPAAALEHLRAGLKMLPLVSDGDERQRMEADLLASSVAMALPVEGLDSPQAEPGLQRARKLYAAMNDTASANHMTYWLAGLHEYRGEFDKSRALMRQRLQTAAGEDRELVELHDLLACSLFHLGEFGEAIQHAREALSHYDSDRDRTALAFVGENAFVTSQHWVAFSLWFTGYPDTALRHSQAAVQMARRPDYAFSLCLALEMAAMLHQLRREPERVLELAGEMHTLAVQGGLPYRQATAGVLVGWARSALGEPTAGCRDLDTALASYRRTGAASELPYFLILYADAARIAGLSEVGQRALDEARALVSLRPSFVAPEIDRLAAALLLQAGTDSAVAEKHLRAALAAARNRGALGLELRAAADLRRLELANGRPGDAARILRSAVEKFTEGHDLPDLRDARELLR